jgi:CBS domain-containing protein
VVSRADLLGPAARQSEREGHAGFYVMLHGETQITGAMPELPRDSSHGVIGDVMTRRLITIAPEAPVRDAIQLMVDEEIHRVLVVEAEKLVGVISSMDVLRMLAPRPKPNDSQGF